MEAQNQDYTTPHQSDAESGASGADSERVIHAFKARGTSVLAWARAHGWAYQSVYVVIERWVEDPARRGRMPLGGVSRAILMALHDELGAEVVPLPDASNRPVMERVL